MPSDNEAIEMNEFHRTITSFLREYGAEDVQIVGGGKHPHIDFLFKDKKFNVAVPRNGEAHHDAALMMTKELRNLLGDPIVTTGSEPRNLEDMTPPAPDTPRYMGVLALYRTGNTSNNFSIRIYPPEEILKWIGKRPIEIQRLAHNTWLLKVSYAEGRSLRQDGAQWMVTSGSSVTKGYDKPIGKSPAEFMKVGGDVTVRLLLDQVREVNPVYSTRAANPHRDAAPAPKREVVEEEGYPGSLVPPRSAPSPAEVWAATRNAPVATPPLPVVPSSPSVLTDARRILSMITEFERATPYRLVRVKDTSTWAWQAPLIKLEEPE